MPVFKPSELHPIFYYSFYSLLCPSLTFAIEFAEFSEKLIEPDEIGEIETLFLFPGTFFDGFAMDEISSMLLFGLGTGIPSTTKVDCLPIRMEFDSSPSSRSLPSIGLLILGCTDRFASDFSLLTGNIRTQNVILLL